MKKFEIFTDSSCDLPKEIIEQLDLRCVQDGAYTLFADFGQRIADALGFAGDHGGNRFADDPAAGPDNHSAIRSNSQRSRQRSAAG